MHFAFDEETSQQTKLQHFYSLQFSMYENQSSSNGLPIFSYSLKSPRKLEANNSYIIHGMDFRPLKAKVYNNRLGMVQLR